MFSDYLEGLYGNRRLGFEEWRDYVELPYVGFSFGYWDRYYRDRPWFGSWERWGDRNDRRWREHRRDRGDGDWNHDGDDGDWSRSRDSDNNVTRDGDNEDGNRTTRRERRNTQDRLQCAPDDPDCDEGTTRRNRRNNQQMDDQGQP